MFFSSFQQLGCNKKALTYWEPSKIKAFQERQTGLEPALSTLARSRVTNYATVAFIFLRFNLTREYDFTIGINLCQVYFYAILIIMKVTGYNSVVSQTTEL